MHIIIEVTAESLIGAIFVKKIRTRLISYYVCRKWCAGNGETRINVSCNKCHV